MSYDTDKPKRKPGDSFKLTASRGGNTELIQDLQMPLLGNDSDVIGNYQLFGQQLKKSLEYLSTVVVQLNSQIINYSNQVNQGSLTDETDQTQRKSIEDKITHVNSEVKKTRDQLHTFKQIQVQAGYETQMRNQEHTELSRKHQQQGKKFMEHVERFARAVQSQQDKQRLKNQRLQEQASSGMNRAAMQEEEKQTLEERVSEAGGYTPRAELKLQEQRLAASLNIREQAEAHQMTDLIQDRNETINMVAAVMRDISDLTTDIKDQTRLQGTKMEKIDEELGAATQNVEQANEQLHEKMERENTGNKCLIWCVVIAMIIVVLLIFFGFVKGGDDDITIEYEPAKDTEQIDQNMSQRQL